MALHEKEEADLLKAKAERERSLANFFGHLSSLTKAAAELIKKSAK